VNVLNSIFWTPKRSSSFLYKLKSKPICSMI
jgi:hypothetical protein